ncbi:aminotransferase class V-fold PLP-dependent enzyme [Thermoanaerobacterium sp. CMT5567-10]|uniref:aminotransferase class V-fold PLP-dependent enzyme n=1 Tax=Thermoanaerobacterium sp. CMT5567-10 TaxID=3061989 RepID=UPI0026DF37BE|nr:aminotransferase class V-fold PLP-dependent enzyme [Thermoanaerobacterium sp. CMT5567-10]WKV07595.1 aminotransferase class V-fold PLP-dependent enzyme [Thermoanaerobacterium sp. CMT5567-10]
MIYFDNAATSYPKPESVYDEIDRVMRYCGNPGRGSHRLAIESGKHILEARQELCQLFNINDPMRVIFTLNTTDSLNIALKGILNEGDHVITSSMEHNSMIRPLIALRDSNYIDLTIVKCDQKGNIDVDDVRKAIKKNTKLIAMIHASNVTGTLMPIREIGSIAREMGIYFLVDAAQTAGSYPIDVEKDNIDLLAFPGHKSLFGPQGTGGLYVRDTIKLKTIKEGGTGSNSENIHQPDMMPDMLESGTPNTPGIAGLKEGVRYIRSIGVENILKHERKLTKRFIDGVKDIPNLVLYGNSDEERRVGVISINIKDIDSGEVSYILDKAFDIATRSGLHCSSLAHQTIGTLKTGTVRFGIGYFNTEDEVDKAVDALYTIAKQALS